MTAIQTRSRRADLGTFEGRHKLVGTSEGMVALTKVKSAMLRGAVDYFLDKDFTWIPPIPAISTLTGACEDYSTLFSLDHMGQQAFLIQTGQQHLETFIRGKIPKVFAVNQSFRAETKKVDRRATVFTLIECECAHYTLHDIQTVQEGLIRNMFKYAVMYAYSDLEKLGADIKRLERIKYPFPRMTYTDAIAFLQKQGTKIEFGADLKGDDEKLLGEEVDNPFFVTHYPGSIKFFNMKDDPQNEELVLSSDLLLPGLGEVVGASEREDRYEPLVKKLATFVRDEKRIGKIKRLGINTPEELESAYSWYLEQRAEGTSTPHAGMGMGYERVVQWAISSSDIREAMEFPRNIDSLLP